MRVSVLSILLFLALAAVVAADEECHGGAALGSASYCTTDCKCETEEGDCDNDDECATGSVCVADIGATYGWAAGTDVCNFPGGSKYPTKFPTPTKPVEKSKPASMRAFALPQRLHFPQQITLCSVPSP